MEEPFKCATRADVAKRAGVSETIVSYVLNNNRYVDKDKRERVLKAVKELHYTPNNIARALKGKNSNHIIFIADRINNEYFNQLTFEMDKYAYEKGWLLSLCSNRNQPDFVRQIIGRRFDGIVISSISIPESFEQEFVDAGIPVVVLQNRASNNLTGAAFIGPGLYHGARDVVRYLYDRGRRNILYIDRISTHNHYSTLSDSRLRGFITEMEACGLQHEGHVITGCTSPEEVQEKLGAYLLEHPVDAVFGRNDQIACYAMKKILSTGRRVPDDVAVVGYDNSSICQIVTPTLTTMEAQKGMIAKVAIDMIYQMQTQGTLPDPVHFPAKMIVREST
ncbi:LacI family DNA-binding transcriptional regulator [Caproiciproducens faecalis]|uniref:LacI family DNA-binding transcriptional regulator n=1 Tax=Caproiciproducens faecalis TaxID=2820301 RepID=A0ABS7DM31_9FIRM|nr:LacI family DNA-binding transcriptional regulator [Caproiciproducens faecalis]MBW7572364.1 LacI family DNA-binding transcriptional regulator [Caproiciproducens faecalis]